MNAYGRRAECVALRRRAARSPAAPFTGRLGLRFDRAEYERDGKLHVTECIPLSPAALAGRSRSATHRRGRRRPVDAHTNLDELLAYRTGKQTRAQRDHERRGRRRARVTRAAREHDTESGLLYRAWVESRARTSRRSAAAGSATCTCRTWATASLSAALHRSRRRESGERGRRHRHSQQQRRLRESVRDRRASRARRISRCRFAAWPVAPARTLLGQRSLEKPTVLVTNMHSLQRRRGFHRRLSHDEARDGRRRADGGLDHLHVERRALRRLDRAHAVRAHHAARQTRTWRCIRDRSTSP